MCRFRIYRIILDDWGYRRNSRLDTLKPFPAIQLAASPRCQTCLNILALFVSNRQQFNETVCYLGGELVRLLLRTFPAEDRSRIQAARGCLLDEEKPPLDEAVCCFVLAPARFAELEQQNLVFKSTFMLFTQAVQACKALWAHRERLWEQNE